MMIPSPYCEQANPIGKVGEYHRSVTLIIIIMVIINYIIFGWSIGGITEIKLMGTSLYELTKGNIMKADIGRRLMGSIFRYPKW